jgi:hypothetical protein
MELLHLVIDDADKGFNASDIDHGLAGVERGVHHVQEALTDVFVLSEDERVEGDIIFLLANLELGQPGVVVWAPTDISGIDEEHTTTRDSGRSSVSQVSNLDDKLHGVGEGNTLVGHKGKNLVIVHDGVEGLNPLGVDVTIEHTPFHFLLVGELAPAFVHVSEHTGKDTITPFLSLEVLPTTEFIRRDSLGIDLLPHGKSIHSRGGKGLGQILPHGGLTKTGSTDQEDGMSNFENFEKLLAFVNVSSVGL